MDSYDLLQYAAETLERLQVRYLITGSMATITHGEARFTNDVDIVADFQAEHIEGIVSAFPAPDYYCSRNAMQDAIRRRSQFNVIHPASGLKIDFMVPNDDEFNRSRLNRGVSVTMDDLGHRAVFASPEDAILKKLQYFREGGSEKHIRDIKGVLMIQGAAIDFNYLRQWAAHLNVVKELEQLLQT